MESSGLIQSGVTALMCTEDVVLCEVKVIFRRKVISTSPSVARVSDISIGGSRRRRLSRQISSRRRSSLSVALLKSKDKRLLCFLLCMSQIMHLLGLIGCFSLQFVGSPRICLSVGLLLEAFPRCLTSNRKVKRFFRCLLASRN